MTKIKCDYYERYYTPGKYKDIYCFNRDSNGFCKLESVTIDNYTDPDTGYHIAQCLNSETK